MKAIDGLTCRNCGYEKVCLEESVREKRYLQALGTDKSLARTCPECLASQKKFVYDHNNGEVVCSGCGLVIDTFEEPEPPYISELEKEGIVKMWITEQKGNPKDDIRFLKFLKSRRNRHGKKFYKPK